MIAADVRDVLSQWSGWCANVRWANEASGHGNEAGGREQNVTPILHSYGTDYGASSSPGQ